MSANTSSRFRKVLFGPGSPSCILIANAFFMDSTRWWLPRALAPAKGAGYSACHSASCHGHKVLLERARGAGGSACQLAPLHGHILLHDEAKGAKMCTLS